MADQGEEVGEAATALRHFVLALFHQALRVAVVVATRQPPVTRAMSTFVAVAVAGVAVAGVAVGVACCMASVVHGHFSFMLAAVFSIAVVGRMRILHRLCPTNIVNGHVEQAAAVAAMVVSMRIVCRIADIQAGNSSQCRSQRQSVRDAMFQIVWRSAVINSLGLANGVDRIDQAETPGAKSNSDSDLQDDGGNPQQPGDFAGCPCGPKEARDAQHRDVAASASHGGKSRKTSTLEGGNVLKS
mmetsp:Transcript_39050/g.79949  ORF Transcript_39050/g.79949 Transcript_39050/m.79949 type:complete len:243 (-) Transcript_39050:21-749(-)